jgi:hypothetical protein
VVPLGAEVAVGEDVDGGLAEDDAGELIRGRVFIFATEKIKNFGLLFASGTVV